MKRLLSWLLALVMIISCLPMSAIPAFAAEEDTDPTLEVGVTETTYDWEADLDEFIEYIDLDTVVTEPGAYFDVTLEAGETVYYRGALRPYAEMVASINYGAPVALTVEGNFAYLEITNETDAEATYTVCVDFPVGHMENPVEMGNIIVSRWGGGFSDTAVIPAGDINFYYYTYTGEGDGSIYLSLNSLPTVTVTDEETGETTDYEATCDIVINDGEKTLLNDGVDGTLTYDVTEGQIVKIQVVIVEDYNGVYLPGGSVGFTGYFEAVPGTELSPLNPWTWNDDYTVANASVTVPEGETIWYVAQYGMILTVNGVETEQYGSFSLTEGTYELQMTYPVGTKNNSVVIEEMPYEHSGTTVAENSDYFYYVWTAEEAGTVTFDAVGDVNLEVEKLTYVEDQEYPTTTQYVLAECETQWDENMNYVGCEWTIQENISFDVVADEVVYIRVSGISLDDAWASPANEYTLTASFEPAVVEEPECTYDHDSLSLGAKCPTCHKYKLAGASMDLSSSLGMTFATMGTPIVGTDNYAEVYKSGEVVATIPQSEWTSLSNGYLYTFNYSGIAAKQMADELVVVVKNSNHEAVTIDWVDSARDYVMRNIDKTGTGAWDGKMKTLAVAMLNYGAAAQEYFEYNAEDLANRYLTEDHQALAPESKMPANIGTSTGNVYVGASLNLEYKIELVVAFYNIAAGATATVSYTDHNGVDVSNEYATGGTQISMVYVNTMAIADADTVVNITITSAEGNEIISIQESVGSYLARKMNTDALYQPIYDFSVAAYNYFHN